jgi:tetratricopeptide (TPR) repeat protein
MSAQIIKNLIGKVLNGLRRLDGTAFDQLVEEHMKARRSRELTSPHVHRKIELKGEPKQWEKLMEYVEDKQWKVVYDFGRMVIDKYKLSLLARISALNAIGTAALRLGCYEEAYLLFKEALRDCTDENRRRTILANLAYVYLRMNKLDLAEEAAKKTIEKSKSYDVGLYNLLCIACAKESKENCQKYFDLLLKFFPDDVKNPNSVLGRGLRNDDDLKFIHEKMPSINAILASDESKKKQQRSVLKSIASPANLATLLFFIAMFVFKFLSAAMSETFGW